MTQTNNSETESSRPELKEVKKPPKAKTPSKTEKLTRERDEYLAMAQRLQAEFDNYRKRNSTLRQDAYFDGVFDTVQRILPVMDDMDRAIEAEEKSGAETGLLTGLKLIRKQLGETMTALGVEEIPAVGEEFDPNLHEAIAAVPEGESGKVFDQMRKGYVMKDRVLRHSIVRVSE